MSKIKVGIVNYLNTAPLIYGLERSSIINRIELIPDYPSNLARDLQQGKIDIGLVPVAVIPGLNSWSLVGDYCIGADGEVASVAIFSEVPIDQIETVILDYQSRTSVALAKILLSKYWKLNIRFIEGDKDFINDIGGRTAAVVIGDRALDLRTKVTYVYDLGEAWKKLTGHSFVFAAWIANRTFDQDFINEFNAANAYGLLHLDDLLSQYDFPGIDLQKYYTQHISYLLDDSKKKGLELFLKYLEEGE